MKSLVIKGRVNIMEPSLKIDKNLCSDENYIVKLRAVQ